VQPAYWWIEEVKVVRGERSKSTLNQRNVTVKKPCPSEDLKVFIDRDKFIFDPGVFVIPVPP
jgi:hypothetical protein